MAARNAFFNIKPTKRSNPEARTTLDALHTFQLKKLQNNQQNVNSLLEQVSTIQSYISTSTQSYEISDYNAQLHKIQKEYSTLHENGPIYDYYLKTGELVFDYYDIQAKIQEGAAGPVKRPVSKPGSIFAALETAAKTDDPQSLLGEHTNETLGRDKLLDSYLQKIDPQHARGSHEIEFETFGDCPDCGTEMTFSSNEAVFTCTKCGYQDFVLIDSDKPSYKDPPREVSYYAYKRINHFNEWLAQFQAKESTEIPQEVYDAIVIELKKERIMDYRTLKASKAKEILKKLKFNKYYEHIPHILNRLNGQTAPVMTREVEEKLRYMFKEIQPSFQNHCPKGRSNFLSYSYVLYKFCELLELDEYLPCFPLLKNRDKLYIQDKIWQKICADLSWEFIRSI
uniref:Viral late gene transcription factor 3 zinc ribbon domain-containing protein n=1 Tax=viral metagenome TaxID=1070528 RepID=A0A6C0DCN6_9ZZZZ